MMKPTLLTTMLLATSNSVAYLFPASSVVGKKKFSFVVVDYKKGIHQHEEQHHPHLKQGEDVLESSINRVLNRDFDSLLFKEKASSPSASTMKNSTSMLPSSIDSLPIELVDMDAFVQDMEVQSRMRIPSFNSLGYKSSLISDLKHNDVKESFGSAKREGKNKIHKFQMLSLVPDSAMSIAKRWRSIGTRLWIQMEKIKKRIIQMEKIKKRILSGGGPALGPKISKAMRSPFVQWAAQVIQWSILAMTLHIMLCHGVYPSALDFHLL